MSSPLEGRWVTIEGEWALSQKRDEGWNLSCSDKDIILVRVADAADLDPLRLRNAQVKITGVGRGVLAASQRVILGKLMVAGLEELNWSKKHSSQPPTAVVSINQVQSLPLEEARRALPVRVRGVVAGTKNSSSLGGCPSRTIPGEFL